jgi:hypothetical protein
MDQPQAMVRIDNILVNPQSGPANVSAAMTYPVGAETGGRI